MVNPICDTEFYGMHHSFSPLLPLGFGQMEPQAGYKREGQEEREVRVFITPFPVVLLLLWPTLCFFITSVSVLWILFHYSILY